VLTTLQFAVTLDYMLPAMLVRCHAPFHALLLFHAPYQATFLLLRARLL